MQYNWNDPTAIMFARFTRCHAGNTPWVSGHQNPSDGYPGRAQPGQLCHGAVGRASGMSGLPHGPAGAVYLSTCPESWIAI